MNLPLYIARRYFFSRKVANVIHIISLISLIGVTVGSFALIVVLSVFNGFEEVVLSLYNSFDSDLKVTPIEGKYFDPGEVQNGKTVNFLDEIQSWENVDRATFVIEENALLKYHDDQTIATIKAMSPSYLKSTGIDSMVFIGQSKVERSGRAAALVGAGVAGKLDLNIYDELTSLQVYIPKKGKTGFVMNPERAFNKRNIAAGGIFSIQQEFDEKYVVVPLDFIRPLVGEDIRVTALEVNTTTEGAIDDVREKLTGVFGDNFEIKDRYQQHEWLYKVMKSEKTAVYLILLFILVIAAFNLIGALLMLAIEKKKDMAILKSMGANGPTIRNVFFFEGLLLSMIGAFTGMALGTLICWLQMEFELIKIKPGSTFVLDAYPVSFEWQDFVLVFITVVVLGLIASYYPARTAYKQLDIQDLHT